MLERPRRLYDDRFGYPGLFTVSRCRRCGHGTVGAHFSDAELEALYTDWYPRGTSRWDDLEPLGPERGVQAWLDGARSGAFRWVPKGVSVLDVGCGFGQTIEYHLNRGCRAVGIEPDAHAALEAQRQGLPVHHGVFKAEAFEPASFDFVTLDQVLEHTTDPAGLMVDVVTVLRPGGTVVVSTPNVGGYGARIFGDRWINWHVPYHVNLFTPASMKRLAARVGLNVESIRTLTASAWARYQWFHWFTRPEQGIASPFWDAARSRLTVARRLVRTAESIDRIRGFELATRATDGLGLGDNVIAALVKPIGG
jgi:2-polyprenyl-3-methyl-5-hydroxy-6-metoxy-1,4-benzoquinol methylase